MLIWINGPFGVGKTQTAFEVARRLPGAVVCDPEEVGFGLHRAMPRELRGDFQDLVAWRQGVVEVLDRVLRRHDGPVVAPMTVLEPRYLDETVGRLRAAGHDVCHLTLLAKRATIVRRLRERGFGRVVRTLAGDEAALRRESFALAKLDLALERLPGPPFAEHVPTDGVPLPQVADAVAAVAGLSLEPDTSPALVSRVRRGLVGVRHIRLG